MPQSSPAASDPFAPFDVVVVGSGAAGLYATLCLPSHLRIGLVTKDTVRKGSSNWAQGGIAAAIAPDDAPILHVNDTLKAGAGLCDVNAVNFLVEHAESAIQSLLELGVAFDRKNGKLAMTLEAAHSRPRVLHSADTTGKAIVSTLAARVLERPHIHIFQHALALNLWLHPQTGRCQGLRLVHDGQVHWIQSAAVVLATGGGGRVFSQTTNPSVSTGDGVAMAWRAGAIIRDLEFFQFHPTALTVEGAPHFLISEAVRGEGAHLVDETGDRFAFHYHEAGELAPRDVVSRAIFHHLQTHAHAYLDLSSIPPETVRSRFPNIIQTCGKWGIDVLQQPIPVAPAAHYWMGGIGTDVNSQTSIPGLYAIGECASTGVHGANRLASNSLLECLVFAAQLAHIDLSLSLSECPSDRSAFPPELSSRESAAEALRNSGNGNLSVAGQGATMTQWAADVELAIAIQAQLPTLMWNSAGISRGQAELDAAVQQVEQWRSRLRCTPLGRFLLSSVPTPPTRLAAAQDAMRLQAMIETLNLLDIAVLILRSALWRQESRGGHYRHDYPQLHPGHPFHTMVKHDEIWGQEVQVV